MQFSVVRQSAQQSGPLRSPGVTIAAFSGVSPDMVYVVSHKPALEVGAMLLDIVLDELDSIVEVGSVEEVGSIEEVELEDEDVVTETRVEGFDLLEDLELTTDGVYDFDLEWA